MYFGWIIIGFVLESMTPWDALNEGDVSSQWIPTW